MFIGNFFNINYLDEAKQVTASVSKNLFRNYKNIPDALKEECKNAQKNENIVQNEEPKQQEIVEEAKEIDYSIYEAKLSSLKKEEE